MLADWIVLVSRSGYCVQHNGSVFPASNHRNIDSWSNVVDESEDRAIQMPITKQTNKNTIEAVCSIYKAPLCTTKSHGDARYTKVEILLTLKYQD